MTGFSAAARAAHLQEVKRIAQDAGAEIMRFYHDGAQVTIKADGSPVTEADHASHSLITARLRAMTPDITIISEEDAQHADVSDGRPFWTVDPLDGTKGFVNRTARFFVKIALIENFRPTLGVIYEPATGTLFHSLAGGDAVRESADGTVSILATQPVTSNAELRTIFNQLHHDPSAFEAASKALRDRGLMPQAKDKARGFCSTAFHMAVATGEADIYVDCGSSETLRSGNGYSWDYAPDWLILKNAGGAMIEIASGQEPVFDKPAQRMNAMIGIGDTELGKMAFPEYKMFAFQK